MADLAGGDAATNAAILRDAFGGARSAVADALNLNAGVALAAAEVAPSAEAGVALAQVIPMLALAQVVPNIAIHWTSARIRTMVNSTISVTASSFHVHVYQ